VTRINSGLLRSFYEFDYHAEAKYIFRASSGRPREKRRVSGASKQAREKPKRTPRHWCHACKKKLSTAFMSRIKSAKRSSVEVNADHWKLLCEQIAIKKETQVKRKSPQAKSESFIHGED
jgi:hypothetical protein